MIFFTGLLDSRCGSPMEDPTLLVDPKIGHSVRVQIDDQLFGVIGSKQNDLD